MKTSAKKNTYQGLTDHRYQTAAKHPHQFSSHLSNTDAPLAVQSARGGFDGGEHDGRWIPQKSRSLAEVTLRKRMVYHHCPESYLHPKVKETACFRRYEFPIPLQYFQVVGHILPPSVVLRTALLKESLSMLLVLEILTVGPLYMFPRRHGSRH